MTGAHDLLYTAQASVTGGRAGRVTSQSGSLDVSLSRPATRGTEAGTDPEELFAAGYAACFGSALEGAARSMRASLGGVTTTGAVSLHAGSGKDYYISVRLTVSAPDCDQVLLEELVALADQMCPYSKAVRGNISVEITVVGRV
jgi:Ohr subfamily peroxiredoxin